MPTIRNGWIEQPINQELTTMILSGLLSAGTRQYQKNNLHVLFSPEEKHPDGIWQHASVSHYARYPDWDEILNVRYSFFDEKAEVVQILPPKGEYVNIHKNCFHLWSPLGRRITPCQH